MANFNFETEGVDVVKAFPGQVKGKIFAITGPSPGGIGAETVLSLANGAPAVLILLGRSPAKCQPVIDTAQALSPSTIIKFISTDLASLASVRQAAATLLADEQVSHIDALINNAAVMMSPRQTTPEGFELQFATSHLGHFLLTNLLMPKLLASASPARIVNVSSSGNKMGGMRWADPSFREPGSYDPVTAYGQAKTASILSAVALNARLAKLPAPAPAPRAYALHPGSIATGLQKFVTADMGNDAAARVYGRDNANYRPVLKTLQQGCATTLVAALDPRLVQHEGVFLDDCQLTKPEESLILGAHAVDPADAERLWKMSEEMVGQKFDI